MAGRAGRKNKQGLVILQTKSPDLPVIHQVIHNDSEQLYYDQLAERQMFKYPPYYRLIYEMCIRDRSKGKYRILVVIVR